MNKEIITMNELSKNLMKVNFQVTDAICDAICNRLGEEDKDGYKYVCLDEFCKNNYKILLEDSEGFLTHECLIVGIYAKENGEIRVNTVDCQNNEECNFTKVEYLTQFKAIIDALEEVEAMYQRQKTLQKRIFERQLRRSEKVRNDIIEAINEFLEKQPEGCFNIPPTEILVTYDVPEVIKKVTVKKIMLDNGDFCIITSNNRFVWDEIVSGEETTILRAIAQNIGE